VVGRYQLTNRIFECIENLYKGAGGEIQLTDGIAALMQRESVLACRCKSQRFDCGSKLRLSHGGNGLASPGNRRRACGILKIQASRYSILKIGNANYMLVASIGG
jgi:dTDP-glucose pyrophosphorylase